MKQFFKTLSFLAFVVQLLAMLALYVMLPGKGPDSISDDYYQPLNDQP